jgi:hypothetical protein
MQILSIILPSKANRNPVSRYSVPSATGLLQVLGGDGDEKMKRPPAVRLMRKEHYVVRIVLATVGV